MRAPLPSPSSTSDPGVTGRRLPTCLSTRRPIRPPATLAEVGAGHGRADVLCSEAEHGARRRAGSGADPNTIGLGVSPHLLCLTASGCAHHQKHRHRRYPRAASSRHGDLPHRSMNERPTGSRERDVKNGERMLSRRGETCVPSVFPLCLSCVSCGRTQAAAPARLSAMACGVTLAVLHLFVRGTIARAHQHGPRAGRSAGFDILQPVTDRE